MPPAHCKMVAIMYNACNALDLGNSSRERTLCIMTRATVHPFRVVALAAPLPCAVFRVHPSVLLTSFLCPALLLPQASPPLHPGPRARALPLCLPSPTSAGQAFRRPHRRDECEEGSAAAEPARTSSRAARRSLSGPRALVLAGVGRKCAHPTCSLPIFFSGTRPLHTGELDRCSSLSSIGEGRDAGEEEEAERREWDVRACGDPSSVVERSVSLYPLAGSLSLHLISNAPSRWRDCPADRDARVRGSHSRARVLLLGALSTSRTRGNEGLTKPGESADKGGKRKGAERVGVDGRGGECMRKAERRGAWADAYGTTEAQGVPG
ncbi:hypothetical protein DFH09DRAFT_1504023 [Mycena vulgaris]|nr:hypothetical protein DFH09DRAFT_1504023 [Mycena vulgaris]